MRLISLPLLAVTVSAAGGLGFIGAGSDLDRLDSWLKEATAQIHSPSLSDSDPEAPSGSHARLSSYHKETGMLPIGIGFFNWTPQDQIDHYLIPAVKKWKPCAIWQFGAYKNQDYAEVAARVRDVCPQTKIWVQVGSVSDAVEVVRLASPDVLVVQGADAGGHGLVQSAGVISLLPEVIDALTTHNVIKKVSVVAAGGIVDGRGVAAGLALGADGVCMGTRFLASEEANVARGYKVEVVRASDGGLSTVRTKVYDQLRGTTMWPERYNARGVINESYRDVERGMELEENKRLYEEAVERGDSGWGVKGRVTTYAGSGVGLVRAVMGTGEIVREVREEAKKRLKGLAMSL